VIVDYHDVKPAQRFSGKLKLVSVALLPVFSQPRIKCDYRQSHCETASLHLAGALRSNFTVVHRHELMRDCQPQTETAILPRRTAITLPEALKDVGQQLRTDAFSGIRNFDQRDIAVAGHSQ